MIKLLGALALAWAIVIAAMLLFERRFIYFPLQRHDARPGDFDLKAEDVWLQTSDGVRLHGWWINHGKAEGGGRRAEGGARRAVLWFHGNGGNISHRLDEAKLLVSRVHVDIFLLDYRGYGRSAGTPSEQGFYRDGAAAYAEARRRGVPPERIVLYGESLGSAVALELALHEPCGGVVLQAPFVSVPALAKDIYKIIPPFLIRTKFDNASRIGRVTAPKLILHGARDEIVPLAHARRLFDLAAPPKRLVVLDGAMHNDTYIVAGPAYFRAWDEFLAAI